MITARTTRYATLHALLASVLLLHNPLARAEGDSLIELDSEAITRLAIDFEAVTANSAAHGFQLPALVIHSPQAQAQLSALYDGQLQTWQAAGGSQVAAGTVIATLSSATLLQSQEAWLEARNQLTAAQVELAKDKQLYAEGIIAKERLDSSRRQLQAAAFALSGRQRILTQAGFSDSDLNDLLKGDLAPGQYRLVAPQAGVVSRAFFAPGDYIPANQAVATVTSGDQLWLRAQVPPALMAGLQPGDQLGVQGEQVGLTLMSKNAELDGSSQTLEILARFDGATGLAPGQQVTLVLASPVAGVRVPASAVTHTGDTTYVYVRQVQGVEVRPLQLQPLGADYLAVTNIVPGEELVVKGTAQLKGVQLGLGGGE
ncbi:efflux RND transporter periplasmic adaptor subunit [Halioxenophilus sp. WMMB6]|uniref:efflux RND transporter periplasmic adaptor subunit n=1 Tax=Halioxenophilus sp. WMMB6 TaxID=3073815 RepID=UPI00295F3772|nr:efflux RND transporter periplasmic adaptor subunit [Halioxenophilus sp. WMMB6]